MSGIEGELWQLPEGGAPGQTTRPAFRDGLPADGGPVQETELQARIDHLTAANERLLHFGHLASHDLRAPVRAIATLPGWLRETLTDLYGNVDPRLEEDLVELDAQARRMRRLLADLLAYAGIGGSAPPDWIDTGQAVRDALADAALPPAFSVTVGTLPALHASPADFALAMRHLACNAVTHHDRPSGRIEVRGSQRDGIVTLEVEDDGPGIEASQAERMFQPFRTGGFGTGQPGSGLGLAIVRRVAEDAGGTARLVPRAGRGALVLLVFPVAKWAGGSAASGTASGDGRALSEQ